MLLLQAEGKEHIPGKEQKGFDGLGKEGEESLLEKSICAPALQRKITQELGAQAVHSTLFLVFSREVLQL